MQAGGTYFVTTETWQRRGFLRNAPLASLVEEAIFRYRDQGNYWVHRHVVMPDHMHLILTPGDSITLEKSVQLIKGGSSREMGKRLGPRYPVWQAGFTEHQIRDEQDFEARAYYIDQNPVRAHLCEAADKYLWGSASGRFKLDPWPVASGAKAPTSTGSNSAGLKPRPSEPKSPERIVSEETATIRHGTISSKAFRSESHGKAGK